VKGAVGCSLVAVDAKWPHDIMHSAFSRDSLIYTLVPLGGVDRAWEELLQPGENRVRPFDHWGCGRPLSQPHEERRPAGACRRSLRRWLLAASRMATTQGRCARVRSAPSRTSQSAYRALKQCASDQALCLSLYSLSTSGGSAGLRRQHRGALSMALSDQLCQTIRRSLGTEALGRPGTLHHGAELMRVQLVDLAPAPTRAG
jgi:hypothetical protein